MGLIEKVMCYFLGHDESVYRPLKDTYNCRACDAVLEEAKRNRFSYPLPLPRTRHTTRDYPKPSCDPLPGPTQKIQREGPPRE